jgi:hypothetical protein
MKYIKKLNIDFDQWEELNKCTYLIFRNSNHLFISYIIKKNNKYQIVLLNTNDMFELYVIFNIQEKQLDKQIVIKYGKIDTILYDDLIKTDFYKNNKILIIGIDVNKEDILKNPELYSNNECETKYLKY